MRLFGVFALLLSSAILTAQVVPGRYIVELEGEPAADYAAKRGGQRTAAIERMAALQAEQRVLTEEITRRGAIVEHRIGMVANAVTVRNAGWKGRRLENLTGVKRIYPVYRVKPLLDHAVVLHHVKDAWNQVGMDQAGLGVKIGVIDTGIDASHPAFHDPSLQPPDGYPLVNNEADRVQTNPKIIVARTYDIISDGVPGTALDTAGHGTAVAMSAAGVTVASPNGLITGMAPKAFLGNYKVFPGLSSSARTDIILKAFDDAVMDGMDVINLSLGSPISPRPRDDIFAEAIERATAMGVIVVTANGNGGPDRNTVGSSATAHSAIGAGAMESDRGFSSSAVVSGKTYPAVDGSGPAPSSPIKGTLVDVATVDPSGLACNSLPAGSMSGKIAFILRGTCLFAVKLQNAQTAGAIAALVYTTPDKPDAITMDAGSSTLPAMMVNSGDGVTIKAALQGHSGTGATLDFSIHAVVADPNRLASFSSRGPDGDLSIKPDLIADGTWINTAAPVAQGSYTVLDGTSFSSPIVAGAAAVLKAARPGLTARQYRSLLINSASPVTPTGDQQPAPVQLAGAGSLNLLNSLRNKVTALPSSISFGAQGSSLPLQRSLVITNIGTAADTFSVSAVAYHGSRTPNLSSNSIQLGPGKSAAITVQFDGNGLGAGEYDGVVKINGTQTEVETHVPFWYAVASGKAAQITVLNQADTGGNGQILQEAIALRVTDASGLPILSPPPTATAVSGGGKVIGVASQDDLIPGLFGVTVRLGIVAGDNVFEIRAGDVKTQVTITGRPGN